MKIAVTVFGCILLAINLVGTIGEGTWQDRLFRFVEALGFGSLLGFIWFLS